MPNRNLKVTLSVGGWTYSQSGHFNFVTDATKRTTFVNSAIQLIEDYGFDGLDLDFEYPSSAAQGQGFADLLTSLRSAFDSNAALEIVALGRKGQYHAIDPFYNIAGMEEKTFLRSTLDIGPTSVYGVHEVPRHVVRKLKPYSDILDIDVAYDSLHFRKREKMGEFDDM